MDANDHRHVMAELDALKQQVASTIQRFEAAGVTAIMKDDYVALHVLEHRIVGMRLAHARAIEVRACLENSGQTTILYELPPTRE